MKRTEFEENLKDIAQDLQGRVQYGESKNNFLATVTGTLFISTFTFATTNGIFEKIMNHLETKTMWITCFLIGIVVFLLFAWSCLPKQLGKQGVNKWTNWRFMKKNHELRPSNYQWWLQNFKILSRNVQKFYAIKITKDDEDKIKKIAIDAYTIHRKYFFSRAMSWVFMIFSFTYLIQMSLIIFIF